MKINVELIKVLREETGAGIMEAKKALEESNGDVNQAKISLFQKGLSQASKRIKNKTDQGVVASYIHGQGKIGALILLNCETDFVAMNEDFKNLARNIAMQVAAMDPQYISRKDADENETLTDEVILEEQAFIKDSSITIGDLVKQLAAKTGENIKIGDIARFSISS